MGRKIRVKTDKGRDFGEMTQEQYQDFLQRNNINQNDVVHYTSENTPIKRTAGFSPDDEGAVIIAQAPKSEVKTERYNGRNHILTDENMRYLSKVKASDNHIFKNYGNRQLADIALAEGLGSLIAIGGAASPLGTLLGIPGGMAGAIAFNDTYKATTGRDWDKDVASGVNWYNSKVPSYLQLDDIQRSLIEPMLNPGGAIGGAAGYGVGSTLSQTFRPFNTGYNLYHSIGKNPVQRWDMMNELKNLRDYRLLTEQEATSLRHYKIGLSDGFNHVPGKILVKKGYRTKQDGGFSLRHELGHASETSISETQFKASPYYSYNYQYDPLNPYWKSELGYRDVPSEILEQRADWFGSLGGSRPMSEILNYPHNSESFILRIKSNPHLFKDGFKSELDWRPKDWFSLRTTPGDENDIISLNKHIPEYLDIEKTSKQSGTWLKMLDGSNWEGDPRSWVQMQSKNFQNYMTNNGQTEPSFPSTIFVTRSPSKFQSLDTQYIGTNFDKHNYSGDYGSGFYFHPQNQFNGKMFDHGIQAYGENVYNMVTNVSKPYTPLKLGDTNFSNSSELFNTSKQPKWMEQYDALYSTPINVTFDIGSYKPELVLKNPSSVKSIVGNNGDFSLDLNNFYKKFGGKFKNENS